MVDPALMERTADALLAVVVEQDMRLDKVRRTNQPTQANGRGGGAGRGGVCFLWWACGADNPLLFRHPATQQRTACSLNEFSWVCAPCTGWSTV